MTVAIFKKPIARVSLAESVYQTILEAILAGEIQPDTELSEVALAGELNVSRTPVHEALRRLTADGLVKQTTNNQSRVVRFTRQDVIEIYEMRKVLESASAERAARQLDDEQLAALRRSAEALSASSAGKGWSARAIDFDLHFHAVLAEASGNSRLRAEIGRYRLLVRAFCRMTGSTANLHDALREHLRILEALGKRDPEAARKAMADHIEARVRVVLCDFYPNEVAHE